MIRSSIFVILNSYLAYAELLCFVPQFFFFIAKESNPNEVFLKFHFEGALSIAHLRSKSLSFER